MLLLALMYDPDIMHGHGLSNEMRYHLQPKQTTVITAAKGVICGIPYSYITSKMEHGPQLPSI